jgi:hypothetical protein
MAANRTKRWRELDLISIHVTLAPENNNNNLQTNAMACNKRFAFFYQFFLASISCRFRPLKKVVKASLYAKVSIVNLKNFKQRDSVTRFSI